MAAGETNALGSIRVSEYLVGVVDGTSSPAGSVTVTAIDPVARTANGTFGFTAAEAPLRTGRVTISNGSFSLSY